MTVDETPSVTGGCRVFRILWTLAYRRVVAAANPLHSLPSMAPALAGVEDSLRAVVQTDDPLLTEVASHLILAGGKRLRPAFVVAAAAAGRPGVALGSPDAVTGGVCVELVHLGSLYHDDVMDDADTRRSVETVNHRWGNLKAILAGDFLLAKASELAASLGTEVAGLLAATIAKLCEGQVRELQRMFDVNRDEPSYLTAIAGKTAALYASSCRIGGLVAGLPRDQIDALTQFGHNYGMAFQIVDDILDVVASDDELGKPAGNDMVQGVYTLPVIRLLATSEGEALRDLLGRPLDESERNKARDLVRANGVVTTATATARSYVDQAVSSLAVVGDHNTTRAMADAARYLVDALPA